MRRFKDLHRGARGSVPAEGQGENSCEAAPSELQMRILESLITQQPTGRCGFISSFYLPALSLSIVAALASLFMYE